MKLPTKLVAVKRISSSVPRSCFDVEDIEKAAKLIIEAKGIINPIILRPTSLESYEVVNGHFEYYASVRAREFSPREGEMIQAIILEPDNENALLEQVTLSKKASNIPPAGSEDHILKSMFSNLEKVFASQFERLCQDSKRLEQRISEMESTLQFERLCQDSKRLERRISEIENTIINEVRQLRPPSSRSKKSIDELKKNPLNLNSTTEAELCSVLGIGPKRASQIIEMRHTKGSFSNVDELAEINGISSNMISKNEWRECFVV